MCERCYDEPLLLSVVGKLIAVECFTVSTGDGEAAMSACAKSGRRGRGLAVTFDDRLGDMPGVAVDTEEPTRTPGVHPR